MRQRNISTTPPCENTYHELLRYLVQSSDPDAGELPFLVGLWDACLRNNGLSDKQAAAVQPYIEEANEFLDNFVWSPRVKPAIEYDRTNVVDLFGGKKGN